MAMSTSPGDIGYGAFGGPINITEHDCLGGCEWKKTTVNWTIHTACEWWAAGSMAGSACFLYGNNELVVSGGNATIPATISCYAYISGTSLHYRKFCLYYIKNNSNFLTITLTK